VEEEYEEHKEISVGYFFGLRHLNGFYFLVGSGPIPQVLCLLNQQY
jgi:hypothetical protein